MTDNGLIDETPRSDSLGSEETATHLLTHAKWCNGYGSGTNETGVRRLANGGIVEGSFDLIQHGWYDWRKAGEVIKRLLAKGRDPRQVAVIMDFIKERGWVNQPPKARTL